MALDKKTALVVSAVLFGVFFSFWILSLIFCKCREPNDESTSRYSNRRFTPEEERMIRQNSERRAQNYRDASFTV